MVRNARADFDYGLCCVSASWCGIRNNSHDRSVRGQGGVFVFGQLRELLAAGFSNARSVLGLMQRM